MNAKTDAQSLAAAQAPVPDANRDLSVALGPGKKPRLALLLATVCGLGYIPFAPGTFGSLVGVLIYALSQNKFPPDLVAEFLGRGPTLGMRFWWAAWVFLPAAILMGAIGVWASSRAAQYAGRKDPSFVVIDEVSGQFIAFLFARAPLNWKYLLLGLILFRVFDIWKPFPARQAESLPGGWGVMTDDWVAGIYAAAGLWVARAAGL